MTSRAKDVEKNRIGTLHKYAILDSPPDSTFDEFTKLAANLLNVPVALISLVDSDRFWFKSKYGVDLDEIEYHPSLCASAILSDGFYEVQDAVKDPVTKSSPLVTGKFGLRFYAAYPLETKKGYKLGTFCVIDKKPRKLSNEEKELLKSLRDLVMDQIELRFLAKETIKNHNRMLGIFAHDLKNPLATINMASDIILKKKDDPKAVQQMCKHIKKSAKNSLYIVEGLLASSELDSGEFQLKFSKFNLGKLLKDVVGNNQILAGRKGQQIELSMEVEIDIEADKTKVEEIMDNLINNAIKYSPEQKQITIVLLKKAENIVMEVRDDGPGFTKTEKKKLFKRFSKLSAKPTGNEISTGLGLYIVKSLVEAHKGAIRAESEGRGKGSVFTVELPYMEKGKNANEHRKAEDVLRFQEN